MPRCVQQLLSEPCEISSRGQKAPRRLGKGDWRARFKLTEEQIAKVFGSLENRNGLPRRRQEVRLFVLCG